MSIASTMQLSAALAAARARLREAAHAAAYTATVVVRAERTGPDAWRTMAVDLARAAAKRVAEAQAAVDRAEHDAAAAVDLARGYAPESASAEPLLARAVQTELKRQHKGTRQ